MIASLTLSSYQMYSFLNLHIYSETNRYVIVRLCNDEIKMVKTFSWYIWKGENNKVIDHENASHEKWYLMDITDYEGAVLFSARVTNN